MRHIYINEVVSEMKFIIVCIFLVYVLWFQYAFEPISGMLSLLGIVMIFLEVCSLKRLNYYRPLFFVAFFMFIAILGIPFALYRAVSINALVGIVKLLIPMVCIFSCIDYSYNRFKHVMFVICITIFALSISLLIEGTQSYTGALVIGDLNSNVYSAFILLGVMATLFMLCSINNRILKILFIGILITECIAQVLAASRRGLIVVFFMLLTYIHSLLSIKYKRQFEYKILTVILVLVLLLILVSQSNGVSSLVVVERLTGGPTHGDLKRAEYHAVAWKQFLSSPFLGNGLASVEGQINVYSHSLYYEVLACTGVLGLVILITALLRKMFYFWKKSYIVIKIENRMENRTFAWSVLGILLTGIAVVFIYDVDFYIFLAIFASYQGIVARNYAFK